MVDKEMTLDDGTKLKVTPFVPEIVELQKLMSKAIADGDVKAIEEIAGQIVKGKADRHKAEVEALQKEAEAMAGDRQKLAANILETVNGLKLGSALNKLKALGFTYKLPDEQSEIARVALVVPTIKAAKAGGTGGNQKTKEEFGMSLDQVFEANRDLMTAEQAAEYDGATNSRKWQIKTAVKKVALNLTRIAPVK